MLWLLSLITMFHAYMIKGVEEWYRWTWYVNCGGLLYTVWIELFQRFNKDGINVYRTRNIWNGSTFLLTKGAIHHQIFYLLSNFLTIFHIAFFFQIPHEKKLQLARKTVKAMASRVIDKMTIDGTINCWENAFK